jgi:hypothetical protein
VATAEEKRLPGKYATVRGRDRTNRDDHGDSNADDDASRNGRFAGKNCMTQVGGYSECYYLPLRIVLNVDGHGADLSCRFSIGTSRPNLSQ